MDEYRVLEYRGPHPSQEDSKKDEKADEEVVIILDDDDEAGGDSGKGSNGSLWTSRAVLLIVR